MNITQVFFGNFGTNPDNIYYLREMSLEINTNCKLTGKTNTPFNFPAIITLVNNDNVKYYRKSYNLNAGLKILSKDNQLMFEFYEEVDKPNKPFILVNVTDLVKLN